jgi:hypothetical protein
MCNTSHRALAPGFQREVVPESWRRIWGVAFSYISGVSFFKIMTAILLALTLAHHNPYHWTMSCQRFYEVSIEIMMDDKLDSRSKQLLLRKFRSKVEERCDGVLI